MQSIFFFFIIGIAHGGLFHHNSRRNRGDLNALLGGYLPPTSDFQCGTTTVTVGTTMTTTKIVPRTIMVTDVTTITNTEYSDVILSSTLVSQIVSTTMVSSLAYYTRTMTHTEQVTLTNIVTIPPSTTRVTHTSTVSSTEALLSTVYKTITETRSVPYSVTEIKTLVLENEVSTTMTTTQFITSLKQLPDKTHTFTAHLYSIVTDTILVAPDTVYETMTFTKTFNIRQGYLPPPIYSYITSTNVNTVLRTLTQVVPSYTTTTSFFTDSVTKIIDSTFYDRTQSTSYKTVFTTIPIYSTSTIHETRFIPSTVMKEKVIETTITLPQQTNVCTHTSIVFHSVTIPAKTQTVFITNFQTTTNVMTSSILKPRKEIIYMTETVKEKCSTGYNYDPPSNPLIYN